jgi:hypothetical protein
MLNVECGTKERTERKEKGYAYKSSKRQRSTLWGNHACPDQTARAFHHVKLADCPAGD